MTDTVQIETSGRCRIIRFNRPDQLNAMSTEMVSALVSGLEAAEADRGIGAVVLTGNGKAFMAGADIKEYAGLDEDGFRAFQRNGRRIYETIERIGKPVIAAVNGYALGGGFEIALACDMIVARRSAKMGLPEVKLGLIPGGGGTQRLVRKIGANRAFELLVSGRHVPAEDYAALGLVNRLTEEDPLPEALALAETMAEAAPEAVAALKALVLDAGDTPLARAIDTEAQHLQRLFETSNARALIRGFAEKSAK
jgi:enoyl-CoA hydratase/carnithine racemase